MKSINDPRLQELLQAVRSIEQERGEAMVRVAELQAAAQQAAEDDLNKEALALNHGRKPPTPKEPEVRAQLEGAQRRLAVLERRGELTTAEVGRFYMENARALLAQLQQAKVERAHEVAELAKPLIEALRGFYEPDDDARALRPYLAQPQGENTGRPESTTTILGGGPQTRQTAFGTDRIAGLQPGELQSVISALINLPARYEDEATVIAAVPEEEAS